MVGIRTTSQILMAGTYVVQFFMRIPKIYFFQDWTHQVDAQARPKAWLLIKTEQASQAEVVRQLGVSNLEKKSS